MLHIQFLPMTALKKTISGYLDFSFVCRRCQQALISHQWRWQAPRIVIKNVKATANTLIVRQLHQHVHENTGRLCEFMCGYFICTTQENTRPANIDKRVSVCTAQAPRTTSLQNNSQPSLISTERGVFTIAQNPKFKNTKTNEITPMYYILLALSHCSKNR